MSSSVSEFSGPASVNVLGLMASEKFQIGMVVQLATALLALVIVALLPGGHGLARFPFLERDLDALAAVFQGQVKFVI